MIRRSMEADFPAMLAIVNHAARAYRGVIPVDRWHEPYMAANELASEIAGEADSDRYMGLGVVGHRLLSAERIQRRVNRRERPPAPEILVDSRKTGRNVCCPR